MRHFKLALNVVLLLSLCMLNTYAQEAVLTSGGDATGSGGSASYSVGQVVYTTNSASNGSVAKGVQQPYEIYATVGIQVTNIKLGLSIYPNPATDILTLKVEEVELSTLHFKLYDIQGKLLESQKIGKRSTAILMEHFSPSTYFLKVFNNQEEIKTFKIIKS